MRDNYQRLWAQPNINRNATSQALLAIQSTGRALPCTVASVNGSLVTVNIQATITVTVNGEPTQIALPPLTIPKAESQWLRAPVQEGDVGLTVPADTFLGGISGQGSGTADTSIDYGNLSSLVFVPVAATSFSTTPDVNKAWVNGPNGVRIGDSANDLFVEIDKESNTVCLGDSNANIGNPSHAGMTAEDVQAAIAANNTALQTWAGTQFSSGTSTPTAPPSPSLPTGSSTVFLKE